MFPCFRIVRSGLPLLVFVACAPGENAEVSFPSDAVLWLTADSGLAVDAPATTVTAPDRTPFWLDLSGSENHAYVIDRPPGITDGGFADRRPRVEYAPDGVGLRFDGADDLLGVSDADGLNLGGPWERRSIAVAFRTSSDVERRQMIFELGGDLRGFNVYLDAGSLHMSAYDLWNDDGGRTTPFGPLDVTMPISAGTTYAVLLELNQPAGTVTGWVNGLQVGELQGAGLVFQHHEDTGIGAINEDTYYHDGVRQGVPMADFFAGRIDHVLVINRILGRAERDALWRVFE